MGRGKLVYLLPHENENLEADDSSISHWYVSKQEIEENSASRRDGIDLKQENQLRKTYTEFLQKVGMKVKVPQVIISTAMLLCYRFFLRQSHANNNLITVASVCMFLAAKAADTPLHLSDAIIVSYEVYNKKDAHKIKQKEVYQQQKEIFCIVERLVLGTLDYDPIVPHPYKPLVEGIKKFNLCDNKNLVQITWNFVNDSLRTSLCLRFMPYQIAAGALFVTSNILRVKLPSLWRKEFNVSLHDLEDISREILEMYEENRRGSGSGSGSGLGSNNSVYPLDNMDPPSVHSHSHFHPVFN